MKRVIIFFAFLILINTYPMSFGYSQGAIDVERISQDKWQVLWEEASSQEGRVIHDDGTVLRVEVPADMAIFFFTQEGHAAHPSIVKRSVVQQGKGISIKTKAWVAGSQEHFEAWLSSFMEQDLTVKKQVTPPSN